MGRVMRRIRWPAVKPGHSFTQAFPNPSTRDSLGLRRGSGAGAMLEHGDHDTDRIDGYDYDIGAVMVRAATANGEPGLLTTLQAWQSRPEQVLYPWQTDDPR
jgi:hypothetical protein